MLKIGRIPVFTIVMFIVVFCVWDLIYWENEWMRALGVNGLQLIAAILSFRCLYKAYLSVTNKQRYFWLLLSIGVTLSFCSNLVWLFVQISHRVVFLPDVSYFILLLGYIFYLTALIYKIKQLSTVISNSSYVFNTAVFMITATAISIHFLIKPVALLDNSIGFTFIAISFPIMSLSILFVVTVLYYLNQYNKEKDFMLFIVLGFILQVVSDSGYAYLSITDRYEVGNVIDLLQLVSLLLIGLAGFYAREYSKEQLIEIKKPFELKGTTFPYYGAMTLVILVTYSWLNALSVGIIIIFCMIMVRQINIMKKNEKLISEYRYLAYHDPLTGLKNRVRFKEILSQMTRKYKQSDSRIALLLIDLDRFKIINDTLGHYVGDSILIKAAKRLSDDIGKNVQIFRLGGDEFVIIIPEASKNQCTTVVETILSKFKKPFTVGDKEIIVTPSIGICMFPENGDNTEDLLKNAEAAMYLAKESEKSNFKFYNTELNKAMLRKMELERQLRAAIDKEEFSIYYQPKVDLQTRKVIGMEALLRWEHPELGPISPIEFIPIAEESGLIVSIGEWVLETACKQNKTWQENGLPAICVSVNVSVRQIHQGDLLKTVKNVLRETGLESRYLELEITESIMQNIEETKEILFGLKEIGVKTAIDDFGTGYSSLNIIRELPIDTIKIDKSFIDDIDNINQRSLVKAIIDLGLNLGLDIVAEGIEYNHQMKVLVESKCNIGQGYLFSKAVEPKEFERILMTNDLSPDLASEKIVGLSNKLPS